MPADIAAVRGLERLRNQLQALTKQLRRRVLLNSLRAGAREVRDEAKRNAPVLAASAAAKVPYRKPGTVQKAIAVRTSKQDRRAGNVGVFVNVKPAKGTNRGAKSPNDPFYWRWLEFGRRGMRAQQFLRPASTKLGDALRAFERVLGPWINKVNASGKVDT